jgi:hypothetical protein
LEETAASTIRVAEGTSETLIPVYQSTQHHISEDCTVLKVSNLAWFKQKFSVFPLPGVEGQVSDNGLTAVNVLK